MIDGYLNHLRAGGASPGTLRLRAWWLGELERCTTGPLLGLARADLTAFLARPGWSPETRKSGRAAVTGFYRWAVDEGLLGTDPSYRLPAVRVPAGVPHPVPEDVLAAALAGSDKETRLMLLLGAYAGLRLAEICQVHSDHVEPAGLRVLGKGGKTRIVPLHPLLLSCMRDIQGWAFPSRGSSTAKDGQHVEVTYVARRVSAALGPGYSCHSLRHRFASRAYAKSGNLLAVQRLLGHSKPETTIRYTLVADESLAAAVAVL